MEHATEKERALRRGGREEARMMTRYMARAAACQKPPREGVDERPRVVVADPRMHVGGAYVCARWVQMAEMGSDELEMGDGAGPSWLARRERGREWW